ncbi:MAG: class F sortase [Oscillochloridaceae bacterium]|nr:class F sortase [Chloroflexaceae bacterium]MDW8391281.1 class F sortase [Oscillochloridaceae bacterium]
MRLFVLILVALLAGCGSVPPATLIQSAATFPAPATATRVLETASPAPMTATPRAATATSRPVTATPGAATAIPRPVTATPAPVTATPRAATATPAPLARRDGGPPVRLVIPAIELDQKVAPVGLDRNRIPIVPKHDVGWYNLSAAPGQMENVVLWGHVLRFHDAPHIPAPFARLNEAPVGAQLILYSADGAAHHYVITRKVWATPDQVEYILPVGREQVTLVSCIGDKVIVNGATVDMTHRLITIAEPR